jgi:hypothetical protein
VSQKSLIPGRASANAFVCKTFVLLLGSWVSMVPAYEALPVREDWIGTSIQPNTFSW